MRVIAKKTLLDFIREHPDAESSVLSWYEEAKMAHWRNPSDVKRNYGSSSILKEGRVVFNICGNTYRLVVMINYESSIVYVRFIGSHRKYDSIDAQTI